MSVDFEKIWGALPFPAFVLGFDDQVLEANAAAEILIKTSLKQLRRQALAHYFGADSPLCDIIGQARIDQSSFSLNNVEITLLDKRSITCNIHVSLLSSKEQDLLVILQPTLVAQKMSRSLSHLSAARSVMGLAAMLAHEIRNPLAGISGAGQLLEMNATEEDRELAELITLEAKRIGELVDRVEHFGDQRPLVRESVNIHNVLDRVRRSATAGFAADVRFILDYDPSLPAVAGDADQLMQVFQNLVKNSAEAIEDRAGIITIRTSFNSGIKLAAPNGHSVNLPIQVEIKDNGKGIPDHLIAEIFDPFVSSKTNGRGLGLSLVSKLVADHSGLIECVRHETGTSFCLSLPVWREKEGNG